MREMAANSVDLIYMVTNIFPDTAGQDSSWKMTNRITQVSSPQDRWEGRPLYAYNLIKIALDGDIKAQHRYASGICIEPWSPFSCCPSMNSGKQARPAIRSSLT